MTPLPTQQVHEPSLWLRNQVADVTARLAAGLPDVCVWLRPGDDALVALWARTWLGCAYRECNPCDRRLKLGGDVGRTCDRCAAVVDSIHTTRLLIGPNLHLVFGLCDSCNTREGL